MRPPNEIQSSAYYAGTLNDRIFKLTGSTGSMNADIGRTPIGCNSNDYAPDAVFKFHLNAAADVQIDTIGTSWDTVLSLHNSLIDAYTTYVNATNTNETIATAQQLGVLNAQGVPAHRRIDARRWMPTTIRTSTCRAAARTRARDAVYGFTLATDTLVRIDMAGSSFDTTVSLHDAPPAEASTAIPANTNDAYATAFDVGSIDDKSFQKTGSTASMGHHYYAGCTGDPAAKDAVYKFTVDASTSVQIDTEGSSFDTVLGLYPSTIVAETRHRRRGHGRLALERAERGRHDQQRLAHVQGHDLGRRLRTGATTATAAPITAQRIATSASRSRARQRATCRSARPTRATTRC